MHSGLRRFLTAGLAALMSAVMLSAPAAALAEEAELIDHNQDGVIDVFDYVISKRAAVAENSPLDLALSDAEGTPGSVVTVSASVNQNSGFSMAKFIVSHDPALSPVTAEGQSDPVIINEALFPELEMATFALKKLHQVVCCSALYAFTSENGTMFDITFRIPEDAVPGTIYTVSYQDAELLDGENRLPVLTKRGKITVITPEEAAEHPSLTVTEPAVTTAPASETTSVTESTSASRLTTAVKASGTQSAATTTKTTAASEKTTATASGSSVTSEETTTVTTTTTVMTAPPHLFDGLDVSVYQGDINFEKIRDESDNKFVMLRAGFGRFPDQEDACFRTNYNRAKAAGVPVGAYWYSYAQTPEIAKVEAHVCAQVLGNRQFEYPIAFDIEEPSVLSKPVAEIDAIIDAFCSEMEKMGYYVMLYCSSYYLNNRISKWVTSRYDVWVANYNVPCPTYTGEYGMWQYGIGECAGIDWPVDVDYCYKDYEEIIKRKHLNGF